MRNDTWQKYWKHEEREIQTGMESHGPKPRELGNVDVEHSVEPEEQVVWRDRVIPSCQFWGWHKT